MGLRAFGAIGDLGLGMFWSLGQTGLRMIGTKGPFEALGQMAYTGFSTFGVLCTFTMPYYSINRDTPTAYRQNYCMAQIIEHFDSYIAKSCSFCQQAHSL